MQTHRNTKQSNTMTVHLGTISNNHPSLFYVAWGNSDRLMLGQNIVIPIVVYRKWLKISGWLSLWDRSAQSFFTSGMCGVIICLVNYSVWYLKHCSPLTVWQHNAHCLPFFIPNLLSIPVALKIKCLILKFMKNILNHTKSFCAKS